MKTLSKLAAFFIFICSTIFGQTYGLDGLNHSLFEKYRVPEIRYRAFYLDGTFNYNSYSYQYTDNNQGSVDRVNENYNISLAPIYHYSYDSESMIYNIFAKLELYGGSSFFKTDRNQYYADRKDYTVNYNYRLTLNPEIVYYLSKSDFFVSLKNSTEIAIQRTDDENIRQGSKTSKFVKADHQNYNVEFGFGYGKIRNVTPLVQAARFQNRLMVLNKLNSKFNDDAMLALAQQFSKSEAYNSLFDRPDKYFWNDIESVLNDNDISLSGLNQYGSSYLREVENELKFMRYEGFRIRSLINVEYFKSMRHNSLDSNSNYIDEQSLISAGLKLEYSKQLNLKSQISTEIGVKGGSFLSPDPQYKQEYEIDNITEYSYELTDRLLVRCRNNFNYVLRNTSESGSAYTNTFRISANYFWEDNITTGIYYNWQHVKYNDFPDYLNFTRNNHSVNLSMSYIFTSNFLMK